MAEQKFRWGIAVTAVCFVLAGTTISVWAGLEVVRGIELSAGETTVGVVTNKRISPGSTRTRTEATYDVQYRFEHSGTQWTAGDATGRSDLWIPLPREVFDSLSVGSAIPILVSPQNPQINRPFVAPGKTEDLVAGAILGILFLSVGVLALVSAWSSRSKERRNESRS